MKPLRVDVWSDVVCPWCHVGKRRLEAALAKFDHAADVEVVWHAFELDPHAITPVPGEARQPYAERLGKKYGKSAREAQAMIDGMTATARADGLDFHFDEAQPGNTFDAHRVIHLAGERGKQDAVKERLFLGYLSEGAAIGERDTVARLAAEAGLDRAEVDAALTSGAYADEVREDERVARDIGIRGVPFFVFDGKFAVSGAQPADALLDVLERAWRERAPSPASLVEGQACGPDGCA